VGCYEHLTPNTLKLVADGTLGPMAADMPAGVEDDALEAEKVIAGVPMEEDPRSLMSGVMEACLEDLPLFSGR
jgi:hypothetical protein